MTVNAALPVGRTSYDIRVSAIGNYLFGTNNHRNLTLIINNNPEITSKNGASLYEITLPETTQAVTSITATDMEGDALSYTLSNHDAGLFEITDLGALSFKAEYIPDYENPRDSHGNIDQNADQEYSVLVTVSDGISSDKQEIRITIIPLLMADGMIFVVNGEARDVDVTGYFGDNANSALTFTAESNNDAVTVAVVGSVVTITPLAIGTATITVTADDTANQRVTQTFMVTVTNLSAPTTVGKVPALTVIVNGIPLDVDMTGYFGDNANSALTFTAESNNDAVTVAVADSIVTIIPLAIGTATITVTARDIANQRVTQTFIVTAMINTGFITTWEMTRVNESITIPTHPDETYNYTVFLG